MNAITHRVCGELLVYKRRVLRIEGEPEAIAWCPKCGVPADGEVVRQMPVCFVPRSEVERGEEGR